MVEGGEGGRELSDCNAQIRAWGLRRRGGGLSEHVFVAEGLVTIML